jgi:hypothetical protein
MRGADHPNGRHPRATDRRIDLKAKLTCYVTVQAGVQATGDRKKLIDRGFEHTSRDCFFTGVKKPNQ